MMRSHGSGKLYFPLKIAPVVAGAVLVIAIYREMAPFEIRRGVTVSPAAGVRDQIRFGSRCDYFYGIAMRGERNFYHRDLVEIFAVHQKRRKLINGINAFVVGIVNTY